MSDGRRHDDRQPSRGRRRRAGTARRPDAGRCAPAAAAASSATAASCSRSSSSSWSAPLQSEHFLTFDNFANVARQASIVGILGIGMTFVILTAGIDLSVGSILGFVAIAYAAILASGVPWPLAILLALAGRRVRRRDQRAGHHQGRHPAVHHDPGHARHRPRRDDDLLRRRSRSARRRRGRHRLDRQRLRRRAARPVRAVRRASPRWPGSRSDTRPSGAQVYAVGDNLRGRSPVGHPDADRVDLQRVRHQRPVRRGLGADRRRPARRRARRPRARASSSTRSPSWSSAGPACSAAKAASAGRSSVPAIVAGDQQPAQPAGRSAVLAADRQGPDHPRRRPPGAADEGPGGRQVSP